MKLTDLDPKWITRDGRRVGLVFRNPLRQDKWWTSCFFAPTRKDMQEKMIEFVLGGDVNYQLCNPDHGWKCDSGPIESATFETLSISPSLDGGSGWWHGHVKNGEIVGGI